MIFVLYFVVGSHFGFPRLVFCSAFGAILLDGFVFCRPLFSTKSPVSTFTRNEQGDEKGQLLESEELLRSKLVVQPKLTFRRKVPHEDVYELEEVKYHPKVQTDVGSPGHPLVGDLEEPGWQTKLPKVVQER